MKVKPNILRITEIFEIRLLASKWTQIKEGAERKGVTFSWLVRMCVFRLMGTEFSRGEWMRLKFDSRKNHLFPQEPWHRHLLCLYGEDGIAIRTAAAARGMTITAFVRLAVDTFLEECLGDLSGEELLAGGVKIRKERKAARFPSTLKAGMENHTKNDTWVLFQRSELRPFQSFRRFRLR